MKKFVLIAILAFMVFGLSPPVQADDLNQIDQTEFYQAIQQDAMFETVIPMMIEVSPMLVLKYPTIEQARHFRAPSMTMTHKYGTPGIFRLDIGENIASRSYRQTYM